MQVKSINKNKFLIFLSERGKRYNLLIFREGFLTRRFRAQDKDEISEAHCP